MHLAFVVFAAIFSGSPVYEAEMKPILDLHFGFRQIHNTARQKNAVAEAFLVFDPQKGAAWIENHGKIDPTQVRTLPAGLKWNAYLVSQQGVAEVPFPVRIRNLSPSVKVDDPNESVWIVGSGKKHGFACGFGGPSGDMQMHEIASTITLNPQLPPAPALPSAEESGESILVNGSPQPRKWTEGIATKQFVINIKRCAELP